MKDEGQACRTLADVCKHQYRYGRGELRTTRQLDTMHLRKGSDHMAGRKRRLDILIQQINWNTTLVG